MIMTQGDFPEVFHLPSKCQMFPGRGRASSRGKQGERYKALPTNCDLELLTVSVYQAPWLQRTEAAIKRLQLLGTTDKIDEIGAPSYLFGRYMWLVHLHEKHMFNEDYMRCLIREQIAVLPLPLQSRQIVEHKPGQLHVLIFLFSASPLKSDKRNTAKPPMKQLMAFVFWHYFTLPLGWWTFLHIWLM